jgi:hypothetical protein
MSNTKAISVREVPAELWQAARVEAMKRGLSMRDFVIGLLYDATKHQAPKASKP